MAALEPRLKHKILHILGTARAEGAGIARIVSSLARGLNRDKYSIDACFLAGDGPLSKELEEAGARVRVLSWQGGARNALGCWRFFNLLKSDQFSLVHQHFGARSVRFLVHSAAGIPVITHLHGMFSERPA